MRDLLIFTGGSSRSGKTLVALNVAAALANMGMSVTLLDSGTSRSSFRSYLGIPASRLLNGGSAGGPRDAGDGIRACGRNLELLVSRPTWSDVFCDEGEERLIPAETFGPRDFLVADAPLEEAGHLALTAAGAPKLFVVVLPEEAACGDVFCLVGDLRRAAGAAEINVIINRTCCGDLAEIICSRLETDLRRMTDIPVNCFGFVPDEPLMSTAVMNRIPLVDFAPHSFTSSRFEHIAEEIRNDRIRSGINFPGIARGAELRFGGAAGAFRHI